MAEAVAEATGDDDVEVLPFMAGVMEATAMVFLTTLDNGLWLIPIVAQAPAGKIAVLRGSLFVGTFFVMALVTCLVAYVLDTYVLERYAPEEASDVPYRAVGAGLCWILAGFLYHKTLVRQRQRREHHETVRRLPSSIVVEVNRENDEGDPGPDGINYGSIPRPETTDPTAATSQRQASYYRAASSLSSCDSDIELTMAMMGDMIPTSILSFVGSSQTWIIVCLTVLGSLDEVAYFPGLIVGEVFTIPQLCAGSLLGSLLVLLLVDVLAARRMLLLAVLDAVPLYSVVSLFAFWLTLKVIYELTTLPNDPPNERIGETMIPLPAC